MMYYFITSILHVFILIESVHSSSSSAKNHDQEQQGGNQNYYRNDLNSNSTATATVEQQRNLTLSFVSPLSRPPSPLFQGHGYDFITLFLKLNQNDAKKEDRNLLLHPHHPAENNNYNNYTNNNSNNDQTQIIIPSYELQMEERPRYSTGNDQTTSSTNGEKNDEDAKKNDYHDGLGGVWSDCCHNVGKIIPKSTLSNHFPVTVSIPNLSSDKIYRFRVRAVAAVVVVANSKQRNRSPWSLPSQPMETNLFVPKIPIRFKVISTTSNSVQLQWEQNTHIPPYADFFHLQYRKQLVNEGGGGTRSNEDNLKSSQNALFWKDYIHHGSSKNIPATLTSSIPEVQEITTLVDDDSTITSGFFWLKLKVPYHDPTQRIYILESSTLSKPIAFNATVESVENAIASIRGVQNVRVFRYEPGRRGISRLSYQGTYSWRIEFYVIGQNAPLFEVHKDTLDGIYSGGYVRCRVQRLVKGEPPRYKGEIRTLLEGLESETYYEFRVRGGNGHGDGPWGEVIGNVKTESFIPPSQPMQTPTESQLRSQYVKLMPGIGRRAGNDKDPDYLPGASMGGFDKENGTDGLVVIIQYNQQKLIIPSRTYFYSKGRSEQFVVPNGNHLKWNNNQLHNTECIDLKLWGGGGAGGGTPRNHSDHNQDGFSFGGGGGFVQTRIKVEPGDELIIKVGSGGIYNPLDKFDSSPVVAGFLGGGQGGESIMGQRGGSGGGSTVVMRQNGKIIAVAGGGGGGGSTDYCCAHGGEGGGKLGGNGKSPETPLYIGKDDAAEGLQRREFTPKDCDNDSCIDPRDIQGLPAFHDHLDRGFAPTASYDIQSEGGKGGSQIQPGGPGQSSRYDIMDNHITLKALPGLRELGGKGADGKEGGGGGGAGFMGGGGGGSGVDGSGGGGGSGYVDYSSVFVSKQKFWFHPERPQVVSVSHDSFIIKWKTGLDTILPSVDDVVRLFNIEMSRGRIGAANEGGKCSDDFNLINTIPVDHLKREMSTTVSELYPRTIYCIRLIIVTDRAYSSRSDHLEVATTDIPKNEWVDVFSREDLDSMQNRQALYSEDIVEMANSTECEVANRPAPRRGHSLTTINAKVYLFGGITDHCICNINGCDMKKIHSNEVWSFDVYTKIWKALSTVSGGNDATIPIGREKHSATLLKNGKILIIGGRTDTSYARQVLNTPLFLGDVWEMDPGQVSYHSISCLDNPQNITEGKISFHKTKVAIGNKLGFRQGDLCIKRVSVHIFIDHPCVEQIGYIALHRSDIHSNETSNHRNAANEAKLFLSSTIGHDSARCTPMRTNITFSDDADASILDFSSQIPQEGTYRPAEYLGSHFADDIVNGHWVLTIFDSILDKSFGTLLDWNLNFEVKYCTDGISWTKLSTNSNSCQEATITNGKQVNSACNYCGRHPKTEETFTPRHSHTSIGVGNDIFVIGGYDQGMKSEIWRFTYSTRKWTQLHDSLTRPNSIGKVGALTPYGIITIGGIRTEISASTLDKDVYVYDVLDRSEKRLEVEFNISSRGYQPEERSFSSITYIGKEHFLINEPMKSKEIIVSEAIMIFGGDIDLPKNNYLEDLWILNLRRLQLSSSNFKVIQNNEEHRKACKDLLYPDMTELNPWDWSCGYYADVNSSLVCTWEEIVRKAWCLMQFQSFISPL